MADYADTEGAPLLSGAETPAESGGSSSTSGGGDPGDKLPAFNKWVPFAPGYWRFHFGTDMLVASWLFVVASAIWVGVEADTIASENVHRFPVAFNHDCTLVCAVLFLLGSIYFVYLSYPEEMDHQMADLMKLAQDPAKINDMSFVERYFTGSDMLVATWFFAVSSLPFVVYGVYAIAVEPSDIIGYVYVLAAFLTFAGLGMWLVAAMPENMVANEGMGSTIFYDRMFSQSWCCCGALGPLVKKWSHTDMLVGMWFFLLITVGFVPMSVLYVIYFPGELNSWLDLAMTLFFSVGAALMVYSAYPENFNSTMAFDTMTCSKTPKRRA